MSAPWTPAELLAVMGARQLRDDTTVFAGVGVPLLAGALAQQRHAPRLTLVIEGGIVGPRIKPGRLPISTNEMRAAHRARMLPGITDTFLLAQRGFLDLGFMGGAQIDRHGNINTSVLGGDDKAGIVAILEALRAARAHGVPHGPVDVLFTICEEVGLLGAKHFDVGRLRARDRKSVV